MADVSFRQLVRSNRSAQPSEGTTDTEPRLRDRGHGVEGVASRAIELDCEGSGVTCLLLAGPIMDTILSCFSDSCDAIVHCLDDVL